MMVNVLVYGEDQDKHDDLLKVLPCLEAAGPTLNKERWKFSQKQVKFLGQMVDKSGVCTDPAKVKAIQNAPIPKNAGDVHRFLGMVNHFGKFSSDFVEKTTTFKLSVVQQLKLEGSTKTTQANFLGVWTHGQHIPRVPDSTPVCERETQHKQ